MIRSLLIVEFPNIAFALFLVAFLLYNHYFDKRTDHLFLVVMLCNILLIVSESVRVISTNGYLPTIFNTVFTAFAFSSRVFITYLITLLCINPKKIRPLQWFVLTAPVIVNSVLCLASIFTPVIFLSVEGQYSPQSGPLYPVPFSVSIFYVAVMIYTMFIRYRQSEIRESFGMLVCVLVVIGATVLEAGFGYLGMIAGSANISVIFVFVTLHGGMGTKDSLTGCFTRKRFYKDIESDKLTAVIMLDLNGLKSINDRFGHLEGDKALTRLVSASFYSFSGKCDMYRLGGDEFSILCFSQSERLVSEIVEKIKCETDKNGISCSIGYAMTSLSDSVQETCLKADAKMYQDKALYRQSRIVKQSDENRELPLFSEEK